MTGDEMERAIEFLSKNQAAFDARQAALDAGFEAEREQTNQQIRNLTTGLQQTKEFLDELSQIVAQNSQDIARNSENIARNLQQIERNSQQLNHLSNIVANMAEGQNRRDEEIDALVKLVGGLIEGRRNGKSES